MGLEGKVAIVSGGARGIGRACSERLAQAGADVVVNYLKDERAAREVYTAVGSAGRKAILVRADVSTVEGAERVSAATLEVFGRADVLVCNAGLWRGAPVEGMSEALWDEVIDVNLKGTWALCRAFVPTMKQAGYGRIVVISSTAGQRGEAFYSNYAASKGGQISFVKSLAVELAPHGINVNAVAPGWVDTEMTADALSGAEARRVAEAAIPIGRVATADDIALPVLFLCSEWAKHINGEVLNVNGGSVLCG
ncbi:MAG TPA: SDR family oxidoreductase [Pyrinomonadaceae bacterium]|nr:SDR family oxidoreductase [Pyrinomonadaceae bacterium]